jgi:steroid delta-isomerase-like uncharacterized protein
METTEKAVARRFYEIVDSQNLQDFDEVCAPDLKGHAGAGSNLAELRAAVAAFQVPFPDLRTEVKHLVQEEDLVSVWLSYTGTHEADFAGIPSSGRHVRFGGWDLMRIRDGRIVELTQYCDVFAIMSQIGALPTASPV